jgi:hypothetical protein
MKTLEFNLKTSLVEVIAQSTDLKAFKTLVGLNRDVNKTHVNQIKESFEAYGTASATITVIATRSFGTLEHYIADGQHRRLAAIELDLPLNVTIVKLDEDNKLNLMKYISVLNNTSKGWNNIQYMESFANCGVKPYKTLQKITKESGLKTTDLQFIFLENDSKLVKDYKKGNLTELPNEEKNMELYKAVMKVIKLIPNKAYTRRALYRSMRLADNFDKFANAIVKAARLMKEAQQKFSENETEFFNHIERIRKVIK